MSVKTNSAGRARHPVTRSLKRLRFTMLFLTVMVIVNLLAGSVGHGLPAPVLADWGIGHDSLLSGEISRLITGTFLSHDRDMFLRQLIFAATVIGYTEWVRGTGWAAALFFALDITGMLIILGCVALGAGVIDLTAMNDVGMSIGGFGLIGVAIAGWRRKWLLLCAILSAIAVKFGLAPDPLADGGHVIALGLGFALGAIIAPPRPVASREARHAR